MGKSIKKIELEPSPFRLTMESLQIPSRYFRVNPFCHNLHQWAQESPAAAQQTLDFLNGKQITCRGNRFVAIVRDRYLDSETLDDDAVMERWVTGNSNFGIMVYSALGIKASVVPGSIRLVKRRASCNTDYGFYRKFTIEFDTEFMCTQPIHDFSDSELAELIFVDPQSMNVPDMHRLQVIKAILQNPGRLYIGRFDRFVTLLPHSIDAATRIFAKEVECFGLLGYWHLVPLGRNFSPDRSQRKALGDGLEMFKFNGSDGKCTRFDYFGNVAQAGNCRVNVRIPLIDQRPDLFVQNVGRGLADCSHYIDLCESRGRIENHFVKFGCFELKVTIVETSSKVWSTNWSENNDNKPQWSDDELVKCLCDYLRHLQCYLGSLVDFVKLLLKDSQSAAVAQKNLIELMARQVTLDPLNYAKYENPYVQELANYCISGEWMPANCATIFDM